MPIDVDLSWFREHLSLNECERLLHHAHWIPVNHGFAATFVAHHYPVVVIEMSQEQAALIPSLAD